MGPPGAGNHRGRRPLPVARSPSVVAAAVAAAGRLGAGAARLAAPRAPGVGEPRPRHHRRAEGREQPSAGVRGGARDDRLRAGRVRGAGGARPVSTRAPAAREFRRSGGRRHTSHGRRAWNPGHRTARVHQRYRGGSAEREVSLRRALDADRSPPGRGGPLAIPGGASAAVRTRGGRTARRRGKGAPAGKRVRDGYGTRERQNRYRSGAATTGALDLRRRHLGDAPRGRVGLSLRS